MSGLNKIILLIFLVVFAYSLQAEPSREINMNGYVQLRFTNDYNRLSTFSVRRTKLFVVGNLPSLSHLSYKVLTTYKFKTGTINLLDAFVEYKFSHFFFRFGQMSPYFSLQWSQPDSKIPLLERALVVDNLIPAAETGGRDIGFTFIYRTRNTESTWGIFNGNGANNTNEDRNFLITTRNSFLISTTSWSLESGFSAAYRKTKGIQFNKILPQGTLFIGKDFRWGLFLKSDYKKFSFQAEYLEAHLENHSARGYYVLLTWHTDKKNDVTLFAEKFNDLKPATENVVWYSLDLSHYFNGHKFKMMIEQKYQPKMGRDYVVTLFQTQVFFK